MKHDDNGVSPGRGRGPRFSASCVDPSPALPAHPDSFAAMPGYISAEHLAQLCAGDNYLLRMGQKERAKAPAESYRKDGRPLRKRSRHQKLSEWLSGSEETRTVSGVVVPYRLLGLVPGLTAKCERNQRAVLDFDRWEEPPSGDWILARAASPKGFHAIIRAWLGFPESRSFTYRGMAGDTRSTRSPVVVWDADTWCSAAASVADDAPLVPEEMRRVLSLPEMPEEVQQRLRGRLQSGGDALELQVQWKQWKRQQGSDDWPGPGDVMPFLDSFVQWEQDGTGRRAALMNMLMMLAYREARGYLAWEGKVPGVAADLIARYVDSRPPEERDAAQRAADALWCSARRKQAWRQKKPCAL